jgi:hypothetical protein
MVAQAGAKQTEVAMTGYFIVEDALAARSDAHC